MAGKPAKTLIFVVEAVTIALAVTIPAFVFYPQYFQWVTSYQISPFLFLGASMYGIGVTINGGCAFGTINQLINGNMNFFGTLLGMVLGFLSFLLTGVATIIVPLQLESDYLLNTLFLLPILFISWVVIIMRARKFFGSGIQSKMRQFISLPIARDFIAVSLLGISSGVLFLLIGHSWDYTHAIRMSAEMFLGNENIGSAYQSSVVAIAGAFVGIVLATILSNSFHFSTIELRTFGVRVIAGILMGIGAGLIPGGNDELIIYGLPGIALHAPVALLIIMFTIAFILKFHSKNWIPLVWKEQ